MPGKATFQVYSSDILDELNERRSAATTTKRGIRLPAMTRSPRAPSVHGFFVFNRRRQIRTKPTFCLRSYGPTGLTVSSIPGTGKAQYY